MRLCTLLPTMTEPHPGPRNGSVSRSLETSTFSTPASQRTLDGKPYVCTASLKILSAVSARLLFEHCR